MTIAFRTIFLFVFLLVVYHMPGWRGHESHRLKRRLTRQARIWKNNAQLRELLKNFPDIHWSMPIGRSIEVFDLSRSSSHYSAVLPWLTSQAPKLAHLSRLHPPRLQYHPRCRSLAFGQSQLSVICYGCYSGDQLLPRFKIGGLESSREHLGFH